jgi:DNA primase
MAEHIPKEFLELLLQRIDLVSLVDARVPLRKKTGSNYFTCCPFHNEKTASFSVSQAKQFYYCFGCGAHGNAIDFLMNYDRLPFPEAVETLAKHIGLSVPHSKTQDKSNSLQQLYAVVEKAAAFYNTQLQHTPQALDYFKKRGLTDEIIKTFSLGYSPRGDALLQTLGKTPETRKQLMETGIISQKEGRSYDRFRERVIFKFS